MRTYPETKVLPGYIREHFARSRKVLDLGFGAGLWFYASFLPSLERIDGFDLYPASVLEAERVMNLGYVPEGYRVAHSVLGREFTPEDMENLKGKRGHLIVQDYREPWPDEITSKRYDLVTEHGGGLAEMRTEREVIEVFCKAARVLEPTGCLLFANFLFKERSLLARQLGMGNQLLELTREVLRNAAEQAGMRVADLHALHFPADMPRVRTFIYGYARIS